MIKVKNLRRFLECMNDNDTVAVSCLHVINDRLEPRTLGADKISCDYNVGSVTISSCKITKEQNIYLNSNKQKQEIVQNTGEIDIEEIYEQHLEDTIERPETDEINTADESLYTFVKGLNSKFPNDFFPLSSNLKEACKKEGFMDGYKTAISLMSGDKKQ